MSTSSLATRCAFVTGAASGIGREIALTLAGNGAAVTVADRNLEGAETVAADIKGTGGRALAVRVDVTDSAEVAAGIEAAAVAFGSLDILVNVAGFGFNSPIVEMQEDDWDRVLGVNLKGQFLCSQAAARRMISQGTGGRIVNIASTAANNARYAGGAYCAAKAGVVQLTRVLALELGEHGITVNAVGPGFTETPATVESTEEYRDSFLAQVPAGRPGRTSDIANAVLFLASPSSEYVNGQIIYVDGGYSAGKLTVRG